MRYDFEFDFDSLGNITKNDIDSAEPEFDDADSYDEDYWDDGCPIEDDYEDDSRFYEDQLRDYERQLRDRITNNEPIYASEIGMYSDLFKDTFGIRPHGLMGWLTEYDNVIDDYAELRARIEANRK